jgi:FkbM family methyltransferase
MGLPLPAVSSPSLDGPGAVIDGVDRAPRAKQVRIDAAQREALQRDPLAQPLIARLAASRRKKIFIDVGAHIGSISIPASFLFDEVFALEPCGETHQQLRKNIAMNERRNIQMHQAAAGAEEGNMVLTYAQGQSGGASLIPEKNRRNQEKVAVVTLDNLVHQKVDFLKVDSEGWDLEVLRGARRILQEDSWTEGEIVQ